MKPFSRPVFRAAGLVAASLHFPLLAHAEEAGDPSKTEIAALRQQVEDLTKLVKDLQRKVETSPPPPLPGVESPAPALPEVTTLLPAADSKAALPPAPSPAKEPDFTGDLSADPLPPPKRTDLSVFNPEFSAAIDAIGSYSSSAKNLNFTIRDIELMVRSNVDQVAHAYVVFNAESELVPWEKTDPFGEVSLGVEEAAVETTSLPYGLALKGGQFFADFSRLGKVHSHELPFTDRPASLEEILGGETKSRGLELSWILPINHYIRFTAGAVDNIGAEGAVTSVLDMLDDSEADLYATGNRRGFGDLMYYARAATIFELGDSVSLNLGADYAHGSDMGTRELASGDFKLTWTPDAASFNRLEVGGEVLHGKTDGDFGPDALFAGGPAGGSSTANGAYIYAQYRIGKTWEPGFRYDWFRPEAWSQTDANSDGIADGIARAMSTQNSFSAYLTYNISEFNRLRFEVSRIQGETGSFGGRDDDWLGLLQWSATIGPHKHSFQP